MMDLSYLIAVSVLPVGALVIGLIVFFIARRDDREAEREHRLHPGE